jgi:hypothetical protein
MFKVRICLLFLFFLSALVAHADNENWLPITSEDMQVKEVPGDPGAAAIQLYYANYIDDNLHSEFVYNRIKILNDKGSRYADVEIPIDQGFSIANLKARTIQADGRIVDFNGKPFEKVIVKGRGIKYLAKTFTLPEAGVGSIIEYKYVIVKPDNIVYDNAWIIQHNLYTVKQSFSMKQYIGLLETRHGGAARLSVNSFNMPAGLSPKQTKDGVTMEASNIPAFAAEDHMPPDENFKPVVRFFYGGGEISSIDSFWQQAGRDWNKEVEHFVGNHPEIRAAATEAIGAETDEEKKLRKLYARAQQVRNLSFEPERASTELKNQNIRANENVADVLKNGYGTHYDIVLLFVALARAAGFQADVLRASSRRAYFFRKELFSERQLDGQIALVKVKGQDVYLDPGTKFCPYGLVRWMRTSTAALKPAKNGGDFVTPPASTYDQAILRRNATMSLDADGTLTGDLTVEYQGVEALERRLDALSTDEAGGKKMLEEELQGWLRSSAVVRVDEVRGWDGIEEPLVARFHLQISGYASTAGKRLVLPPSLFSSTQGRAFKSTERKYPVYFPYSQGQHDTISIKVPDGYTVEGSPSSQNARLPYAVYISSCTFKSGQLMSERKLYFNGFVINVKEYPNVRDFFGKVQSGDEQEAVLQAGGQSGASKGN